MNMARLEQTRTLGTPLPWGKLLWFELVLLQSSLNDGGGVNRAKKSKSALVLSSTLPSEGIWTGRRINRDGDDIQTRNESCLGDLVQNGHDYEREI